MILMSRLALLDQNLPLSMNFYFVPSQEKKILFNPVTIKQLKNIIYLNSKYPILNSGFNYGIIDTIENNTTEKIKLTALDKFVLLLQIHFNEIRQQTYTFKSVESFAKSSINYESCIIDINIPFINEEKKYYNFIIQNNIVDKNELLICEISKYITNITIQNQTKPFKNIKEKNNIIRALPIPILANCVVYIDKFKHVIKKFYNNKPYDISLLIP